MELVSTNFDKLSTNNLEYNEGKNLAAYTFLMKSIVWKERINKDTSLKTFIHPETGIEFQGYTAGGWSTSDLRAWSNDSEKGLLSLMDREENSGLIEAIKEVNKVSDIGAPSQNIADFQYALNYTNDKIWLPSLTELATKVDNLSVTEKQSSQYYEYDGIKVYRPYEWFSNNQSRLKTLNGEYAKYFTRTQAGGSIYRFFTINELGQVETKPATETYGYIFGFCI